MLPRPPSPALRGVCLPGTPASHFSVHACAPRDTALVAGMVERVVGPGYLVCLPGLWMMTCAPPANNGVMRWHVCVTPHWTTLCGHTTVVIRSAAEDDTTHRGQPAAADDDWFLAHQRILEALRRQAAVAPGGRRTLADLEQLAVVPLSAMEAACRLAGGGVQDWEEHFQTLPVADDGELVTHVAVRSLPPSRSPPLGPASHILRRGSAPATPIPPTAAPPSSCRHASTAEGAAAVCSRGVARR